MFFRRFIESVDSQRFNSIWQSVIAASEQIFTIERRAKALSLKPESEQKLINFGTELLQILHNIVPLLEEITDLGPENFLTIKDTEIFTTIYFKYFEMSST